MPYMDLSLILANNVLAPVEGFDPEGLRRQLEGAEGLAEGAERLGLFAVIDPQHADGLRAHLEKVPASLGAAILAGLLDALGRGLRTQVIWQPGYDFALQMWETSDIEAEGGPVGSVTFLVTAPHPPET